MKTLTENLTQYAAYHRDLRNLMTHFVGIPMIVAGVAILLSRPSFELGASTISPALIAVFVASVYYLILDMRLGIALTLFLAACLVFGQWCAVQATSVWLGWGLGLFIIGWIIQFLGHFWEGKKPAFLDDIMGLMIGPLFVATEIAFLLGFRKPLKAEIERVAGPVRVKAA
jgi:uncharacterized membrane protein YGL010W